MPLMLFAFSGFVSKLSSVVHRIMRSESLLTALRCRLATPGLG